MNKKKLIFLSSLLFYIWPTHARSLLEITYGLTIDNEKINTIENQENESTVSIGGKYFPLETNLAASLNYTYFNEVNYSGGPIISQELKAHGFGFGLAYLNPSENGFTYSFKYFPDLKTEFNRSTKHTGSAVQFEVGYKVNVEKSSFGFNFTYQKITVQETSEPHTSYLFTDLMPTIVYSYRFDG